MPPQEQGRIDWRPNLKLWSVYLYVGKTDKELGRYKSHAAAARALQEAITTGRRR